MTRIVMDVRLLVVQVVNIYIKMAEVFNDLEHLWEEVLLPDLHPSFASSKILNEENISSHAM